MSDDAAGDGGTALRFSRFTLLPQRQLLLDGEEPVRLGSRPMAILTLLVQRAGELVTKDEILAHAWPNISVDEGALRVHMATLRKTLGGDGFISNVVGRGYQFVHPLLPRAVEAPPPAVGAALPPAPGTVFGRDSATAELSATRADARLGVAGVADDHLGYGRAHHLQEFAGDALLNENPRAGETDLAGVAVLVRDGLSRGIQVGVGKNDEGRLASQLHADGRN